MKLGFLRKLIDNKDASANSKIVYSGITMLLVVSMVVMGFFGVAIELNILLALLGFILSLLGINALSK